MPMKPVTIAALITPARVVPALQTQDLPQAVERLAGIAAGASSLDDAAVFRAVLARSRESSFVYGRGVALPHAMVPGLKTPTGVFARLSPALDVDAPDGRLVDLVLLILGPEGDHALLLRALACAARRLRDPDVAARLRSADGAEAIHAVLTTDAWRGEIGSLNETTAERRIARI
jgi:PTS system nitrogen regulatory IIA component